MKTTTTELEPIEVLCVTAEGGVAGGRVAFEWLESRLPGMRGRRFYGVMHRDGTYRACVVRAEGDDPGAMGLETDVLPGGAYARTTIPDWEERVAEIATTFDALAAGRSVDPERPSIEFYRSQKELVLFLPVAEED